MAIISNCAYNDSDDRDLHSARYLIMDVNSYAARVYAVPNPNASLDPRPEVMESLRRSMHENADVWTELSMC